MIRFRYVRLFLRRQTLNVQAQMEYKLDFVLGNSATILGQTAGIAFVWILFQRIGNLNGWTLPQIMLIYGVSALPYGLFELTFNGLWGLNHHIRTGSFDEFAIRPGGALFWILSDGIALHGIGTTATGIVIIAIASRDLAFAWTIERITFLTYSTI